MHAPTPDCGKLHRRSDHVSLQLAVIDDAVRVQLLVKQYSPQQPPAQPLQSQAAPASRSLQLSGLPSPGEPGAQEPPVETEVRSVMARLLDKVAQNVLGQPASVTAEASGFSLGADHSADFQLDLSVPDKRLRQADQSPQRLTGVVQDLMQIDCAAVLMQAVISCHVCAIPSGWCWCRLLTQLPRAEVLPVCSQGCRAMSAVCEIPLHAPICPGSDLAFPGTEGFDSSVTMTVQHSSLSHPCHGRQRVLAV